MFKYATLLIIYTCTLTGSRPLSRKCDMICEKYLHTFGYSSKPNKLTVSSFTHYSSFDTALVNMQREAGIDESGLLDQETYALMQTPRCGLSFDQDMFRGRSKRFATVNKWTNGKTAQNETIVTWYIAPTTNNTLHTNMSDDIIETVFANTLQRWSDKSLLHFRRVNHVKDAAISIHFVSGDHGDGFKFDGSGNILAHAFYPASDPQSQAGDAHFDADEQWDVWGYNNNISLFAVALHEFGHSLGLAHSSQKDSVMYAWYKSQNINLSEDDELGMSELYGSRSKFGPRTFQTTTTSTTTSRTRRSTRRYRLSNIRNLKIVDSRVFIYPQKTPVVSF
jgi:hypothetical protein